MRHQTCGAAALLLVAVAVSPAAGYFFNIVFTVLLHTHAHTIPLCTVTTSPRTPPGHHQPPPLLPDLCYLGYI